MTQPGSLQKPESASEITKPRPGARPTRLPPAYDVILDEYAAALEHAPLSAETRRTYRSRVRMYLAWLADHTTSYTTDPLTDRQARDWTVRDYRMWLLRAGPARRSRVYVNSALTALDDFHVRSGLGKAGIAREDLPKNAPRALEERARIRWLRAVEAHPSDQLHP
ncbi:hypothetical protein [Nonomuraea sp. NPDC049158]|uniref:hypothetical protein n=1 Tax=Nonomuraea sp. NPDC049158 TaxID=3155649 RepID=UPI0033CA7F2E